MVKLPFDADFVCLVWTQVVQFRLCYVSMGFFLYHLVGIICFVICMSESANPSYQSKSASLMWLMSSLPAFLVSKWRRPKCSYLKNFKEVLSERRINRYRSSYECFHKLYYHSFCWTVFICFFCIVLIVPKSFHRLLENKFNLNDRIEYTSVDSFVYVPTSTFKPPLSLAFWILQSTNFTKIGRTCHTCRNAILFTTCSEAPLSGIMCRLDLACCMVFNWLISSKELGNVFGCVGKYFSWKSPLFLVDEVGFLWTFWIVRWSSTI